MSARVAAPIAMKELVLSESWLLCEPDVARDEVVGRLPHSLDGAHADENAGGLSLCGSYKSHQANHNTDEINGLGIVRGYSHVRVVHDTDTSASCFNKCDYAYPNNHY
jgi:hypothetical protein